MRREWKKMFDLCKLLGVEEGEEFKVITFGTWLTYKIERNKLMYLIDNERKWVLSEIEVNTFAEAEIERLPFVPKHGQEYWSPAFSRTGEVISVWTRNEYKGDDLFAIKLNLAFRTKDDCDKLCVPLMEQWKKELGWYGDGR